MSEAAASVRPRWREPAVLWTLVVIAIATVVYLPALHAGFLADDVYQLALLDGVAGERGPWALYSLFIEDPAATAAHVHRGSLPWWTTADFRFVQLRPLPSLLLALDHGVWPHDAFAHHLHSMVWLAATLGTAAWLLRRVTSPAIASLALLVFAIDESFGWTVGWLANRCTMVAATFAFAALAVHLRRAAAGADRASATDRRTVALELVLWLLAFASGEYALCGLAYALAFGLLGRTDPWRIRARALVPALGAFAAFAIAYVAVQAGVSGGTSYVDPLAHPGRFALACLDRVPRMLGEITLGLSSETERLLFRYEGSTVLSVLMTLSGVSTTAELPLHHPRLALLAMALVLLPAWWLARRHLQPPERRAVAWTALGSLLALVPLSAILPSTRALAIAAFGPAVLVASLAVAALRAWRARPSTWSARLGAVGLSALALPLLVQHTLYDAPWARAQIAGLRSTGESYLRFHDNEHTRRIDVTDAHVVVLAAPGLVTGIHGQWIQHVLGLPRPRSWHVLEIGERRLLLRRFDERGLELSTVNRVMFDQPQETLFRAPQSALHTGDEIDVGLFRATVVHERPGQGPDAIRFVFDRPLDDPSLRLLVSGPDGLEPFELPAVGRAVALPPPVLPGREPDAARPR